jgi:hypothetical protein
MDDPPVLAGAPVAVDQRSTLGRRAEHDVLEELPVLV